MTCGQEGLNRQHRLRRDGDGPGLPRLGRRGGDRHQKARQVEVPQPELEALSRPRPAVQGEQHECVVPQPRKGPPVREPQEIGQGVRLDVHDAPHGTALLEPGQGVSTGEQAFLQAPAEELLEVRETEVVGVGVDVIAQVREDGRPVVLRPLGDSRGERRQMGAVILQGTPRQPLGLTEGQKQPDDLLHEKARNLDERQGGEQAFSDTGPYNRLQFRSC